MWWIEVYNNEVYVKLHGSFTNETSVKSPTLKLPNVAVGEKKNPGQRRKSGLIILSYSFESVDPHSSRTRVAIFLGLPLPGTAAGGAAVGVQGGSLPGHAHRHPAVNTRRDSTPKRALAGRVKLLTGRVKLHLKLSPKF